MRRNIGVRNKLFTSLRIFFSGVVGYNKGSVLEVGRMTIKFLILLTVAVLFLTAILTAAYNDDKTKGI
jgi:hypothetical protein